MRRINFAALVAMFLFGGALHAQESPLQAEFSPQVTEVLTDNPNFDLYEVIAGTNLWDLAMEMYGDGFNWPYIYGWNVQAGLLPVGSFDTRSGSWPYHVEIESGDLLVLVSDVAAGIPDVVRPYTPTATPGPIEVVEAIGEDSGLNWWMWFLIFAVSAIAFLLLDRRFLKKDAGDSKERLEGVRRQNDRLEGEFTKQRQDDFEARRSIMPMLPDGVEDGVLAGPPMRFEGITRNNRDEVLDETARAAYRRLHQGAETDSLTFYQRDVRRVLISSRPDKTFRMIFGDIRSREVTLVREPGWIFNAMICRDGEVIQELNNICVIGSCANIFEYQRSWIEGALIEPFEQEAIHSFPDWEAVDAEAEAEAVEESTDTA